VASWGIALFEYLLQVPANRIGYTALSLAQLKILQEVITLVVFVPFAVLYMRQPVKLDYLWAGLCIMGAVYFVFRSHGTPVSALRRAAVLLVGALSSSGRVPWRRSRHRSARTSWASRLDGTPGPLDAITDVRGVTVGHATIIRGAGRLTPGKGPVRTGVTAILPRGRDDMSPGVRRLVQPQRQRRDDRHGLGRRLWAPVLSDRHHQHQQRRYGTGRAHRMGARPACGRAPLLPARSWPRPGTAT
jgi:hypothetical protein